MEISGEILLIGLGLIGSLVAALWALIRHFLQRIERVQRDGEERIQTLEDRMNQRIDRVDDRVRGINGHVVTRDELERALAKLEAMISDVLRRLDEFLKIITGHPGKN